MAVSAHPWMRSPECEVHWDGFVGSTIAMQRCGWEFAFETNHSYGFERAGMVFRHRAKGWIGMARCVNPEALIMASSMDRRYDGDNGMPAFQAVTMKDEGRIHTMTGFSPTSYRRIDMEPEVELARSFHPKMIFREWREPQEIIVEPKTVQALLEEIKQLQSPELAEIRKRNRERPLVDQVPEFARATILQYGT